MTVMSIPQAALSWLQICATCSHVIHMGPCPQCSFREQYILRVFQEQLHGMQAFKLPAWGLC